MTGQTAATIGLGALALTAIAIKSAVSWAKRRPVPTVADATLPDPRDSDILIGDLRRERFTAISSILSGYPDVASLSDLDVTLPNLMSDADTAQRDRVYVLARDAADTSGSAVGIYVTGGGSEPVIWSYQEPDGNGRLKPLYVDLVYPSGRRYVRRCGMLKKCGDVTRRNGDSDIVHVRLKKVVEKREKAYLWTPADMIWFKPALLSVIYGDGRALFTLSTINQRPRYYIIRGSSDWDSDRDEGYDTGLDFVDMVDDILTDIEEEFGRGRCRYSGSSLFFPKKDRVQNCKCEECTGSWTARWPVLDDEGGCSLSRMNWPHGFQTVEDPLCYKGNLLVT